YSGSLQIKKKAELQEIAQALAISDAGTREDLQLRIKKHLDDNSTDLEGDPAFSGLFSRKRQRSLQPQGFFQPSRSRSSELSKFVVIPEKRENTPGVDDLHDVSMMLPRAPLSPEPPSPSPQRISSQATPSSLPPLPSSPARSIIADALAQPEVQAVVALERNAVGSLVQALSAQRAFLSSARNIFIMTALLDFVSIVFSIHKYEHFPIPPITVQAEPAIRTTLYATSAWAIPSVLLPIVVGYLVSFSAPATLTFDALSASIARVAGNVAYSFPMMVVAERSNEVQSFDVLGIKWRVLSASITLAFAFAEAIGKVPIGSQTYSNSA
ncbi:hypothetical protein DFH11DRAFT_1516986, partial [Phellopilus nigrolimitatus]